jgi:hypothetical protein
MPRKPSCRRLHVAPVRVVLRRFVSSPCVPSRAVSARVESCIAARCVFCVAGCILACFSAHCMLHRFIGTSETRSPRYGAPPCGALCGVLCVRCSIGRRVGCCGCRAAARCTRAQSGSGGVLVMYKGTALFDTVAISGSEAAVRAGLVRRCAVGAGVCGRGARADCSGRGCAGLCAGRRRRGEHARWRRDVQGRLDLEQHGGVCAERESRVRAPWYGMLRGAARPMDGAQGEAHACRGEHGVRCTAH